VPVSARPARRSLTDRRRARKGIHRLNPPPAADTRSFNWIAAKRSVTDVAFGSLCRALHSDPYAQVATMRS